MTMPAAITQTALGFSCRHSFLKPRREQSGLGSTQRLFFARCGIDYKSSVRAAVASQLFGGTRELRIVAAVDQEVSRRNLHHGKDNKHNLESRFWSWMFLSGFSSSSSFAEVAFASEDATPNAVYEVSALFEFGIQLIYLGALISLLGVGSFFVVRQIVIRRELENAAKELQERVRSGEANAVEYFELGAVMLRKKFYPLAAKYLEQAIEKWEGDVQDLAQVHNALGFSYASDGKLDKGIMQYEKAVELQPGYVTAWNNMGDAFEKKKDLKAALKAYEQTLRFNPNDKVARSCRDLLKERVDLFEGIPAKSKGYKKM